MSSSVRNITVDAHHPYVLSLFWSDVTGFVEDPHDPNLPEHEAALLVGPPGHPGLLFIRVAEDQKITKNRVHLDVVPTDRSRDDEVARLLGLGASQVADHRKPDGTGWVVLADPEGNEFCVERSMAERAD